MPSTSLGSSNVGIQQNRKQAMQKRGFMQEVDLALKKNLTLINIMERFKSRFGLII